MQQAVGEQVAAVGIGAHLDFVDAEEGDAPVDRHRLDGAQEPRRLGRNDLFLAGDQRDPPLALDLDRPLVVLAGEQAQREADHARRVTQHPLHRQMGLAGVGRAQHGDDAGPAAGEASFLAICPAYRGNSGEKQATALLAAGLGAAPVASVGRL